MPCTRKRVAEEANSGLAKRLAVASGHEGMMAEKWNSYLSSYVSLAIRSTLIFEPNPSSMTCRERLVIIKFRFARDYKSAVPVQNLFSERWSSKSVSAVVIKFMSLRCTCAINSAAKPIDQLRKYSAAYPAQKKECQSL